MGLIEAQGYIGYNEETGKKRGFVVKVTMEESNMRALYKIKKIIGAGKIDREEGNRGT